MSQRQTKCGIGRLKVRKATFRPSNPPPCWSPSPYLQHSAWPTPSKRGNHDLYSMHTRIVYVLLHESVVCTGFAAYKPLGRLCLEKSSLWLWAISTLRPKTGKRIHANAQSYLPYCAPTEIQSSKINTNTFVEIVPREGLSPPTTRVQLTAAVAVDRRCDLAERSGGSGTFAIHRKPQNMLPLYFLFLQRWGSVQNAIWSL